MPSNIAVVVDVDRDALDKSLFYFRVLFELDDISLVLGVRYLAIRVEGSIQVVCKVDELVIFPDMPDKVVFVIDSYTSELPSGLTKACSSDKTYDPVRYVADDDGKAEIFSSAFEPMFGNGVSHSTKLDSKLIDFESAKDALSRRYGVKKDKISITISV